MGHGDSVVIKNILRTVVVVCLPAPDNGYVVRVLFEQHHAIEKEIEFKRASLFSCRCEIGGACCTRNCAVFFPRDSGTYMMHTPD